LIVIQRSLVSDRSLSVCWINIRMNVQMMLA